MCYSCEMYFSSRLGEYSGHFMSENYDYVKTLYGCNQWLEKLGFCTLISRNACIYLKGVQMHLTGELVRGMKQFKSHIEYIHYKNSVYTS